MDLDAADVVLRLTAAAGAGAVVGIDRDAEGKPIGARTLALVSLAAAALTVATIQVPGLYENKDALSRVVQGLIQGLMAGIGFVGAGVIIRKPDVNLVKGLTTAATVWLAASLGICCGLGQWTVVVVSVVLGLFILVVVRKILDASHIDSD